MTQTAITSPGQATARASDLAATLVCIVALLVPALWNGYPLLQYDTGGYLARWYEGYLVPSRSTVFGLFLHLGEGVHFWPELVLQAGCTVWVIWLVLRVFGLGTGPWRLAVIIAVLSLLTALPVLSSMLLTDIFAGVAVLSLHLVIFHRSDLRRTERLGLFLLIAFAAATHSATLAVLLATLIFSISGAAVVARATPCRASHGRRRHCNRSSNAARREPCPVGAARLDAGWLRNCVRPHAGGRHREALSRRPLPRCAAQALSLSQRAAENRR